jgi:hypothetical protein
LSHLRNIPPMPQIDAASGDEVLRGDIDRISKGSEVLRVRSRVAKWGWGPICLNEAVGSKHTTGRAFLSGVADGTIKKGHGWVVEALEVVVSALHIIRGSDVHRSSAYVITSEVQDFTLLESNRC